MYTIDEAKEATLEYFGGDELATSVFIDKYDLRDDNDNLLEKTPEDMHRRMAKEVDRIEKDKFAEPLSEDEIFNYFDRFERIVPQGSIMYGLGNLYKYVSLSNCYVIDLQDSYASICKADEELIHIAVRRGGVGLDISTLRPEGTPTKNAARTSTGIVPFMERFSNSIREVCMSGRRGALLESISIHHPEVLSFIRAKQDLSKITGANISVMLTNEFLQAVENDEEYEQRWPTDSKNPKISNRVRARDIWNEIIKASYNSAEPGLMFIDTIRENSPADCYEKFGFRTLSSNPCCFSVDQNVMVITNNGIKEIKTITDKDKIWINKTKEFAKCSGYFKSGIANIYKVDFGTNDSLVITKNHKLAKVIDVSTFIDEKDDTKTYIECNSDLVELQYLKIGDVIETQKENNGVGFTTIVNIEHIGENEVGCIEVEKYHQFTANNIISGNSELPLCPYDSCRLILLNLYSYVNTPFKDTAKFDYDRFYNDVQIAQRIIDDVVDLELECINRIIQKINSDPENEETKFRAISLWTKIKDKCQQGRRTGTGITALGDCLAALNIEYGSEKSIEITNEIYKTLKFGAYKSSIDMAKEIGSFPIFDAKLEKNNIYFERFKNEDLCLSTHVVHGYELISDMEKYGRRNIACLTTSPAGSVSLLTQTTSGIEPAFQLKYTRRKKITDRTHADFVDKVGDRWKHYDVLHPKLKEWMKITKETDIEKSPWVTTDKINWENRVRLQAVATQHTDHSISSTTNVPSSATIEDIEKIYETAWKSGCKGITVYRDGCRDGVLVKSEADKSVRPRELDCDVHHIIVNKTEYFALVGLWEDGTPYEMFAGKNGCINKKITKGKIIRKRKDFYKFVSDDGDYELAPITGVMSDVEETISRLTSGLLRCGGDMDFIVTQLEKIGNGKEDELHNFGKCLARALRKNYISDNTPYNEEKCPDCGGSLVRVGGCPTCSCGWSKCL